MLLNGEFQNLIKSRFDAQNYEKKRHFLQVIS